jgi:hypothetical protein
MSDTGNDRDEFRGAQRSLSWRNPGAPQVASVRSARRLGLLSFTGVRRLRQATLVAPEIEAKTDPGSAAQERGHKRKDQRRSAVERAHQA